MIARAVATLRSLWSNLVRRERVEEALDDEVRTYVELLAAEYEHDGMTPEDARRAALVTAGGVEQIKEATRDAWAGSALSAGARELHYAVRTLRRSPTFLAVAVGTLAIGIGGATAVFTVIKASLLRPLPATEAPDRLVTIERIQPTGMIAEFSYPDYQDLGAQTTALTGIAGFNGTSLALEDSAGSTQVWTSFVTDEFFTVLGVRPAAGRFFVGGVNVKERETAPVAVLGYALWQSRFGGSPSVIGSAVKLNGQTVTIIGVAPPRFIGAMATHTMEVWLQIMVSGEVSPTLQGINFHSRRDSWVRLVGRLAPGRSLDDAQRDLAAIASRLAAVYPENKGRSVRVLPRTGMTAEERADISRVPRLLAFAVGMLLLIACGNVAGLSLVRAGARRRELATRMALGASRAALMRQVVLEGVLVAASAGLLGVLLAQGLVRSATLVDTVVSMQDMDLSMDLRVLGLAIAAATLTATLVSLLPALQIRHLSPGAVLKDGGGAVRRSTRGQRVLVVGQVGASLVLLSAAAIIFGAFRHVIAAQDGFDPRRLTDAGVDFGSARADTARQVRFFQEFLTRATADPEVAGAALASNVPPFQWASSVLVFRPGEAPPPGTSAERRAELGVRVQAVEVSEQFFDVTKIPLVNGRRFATRDTKTAEPVAIVSRRLAAVLWPSQNPIDRMIAWPPLEGPRRPDLRVVGVAEDTRDVSMSADAPLFMYLPYVQRPHRGLTLLLRSRGNSAVSATALRRVVASVDPQVRIRGGQTLYDRLVGAVRPQRTASAWVGVFAVIALLLASIGLYGVIAQSVLQRTREIAVRSALGATPRDILALVLNDGMRIAAVGLIVGGLGSIVALRVLRSSFAGVETGDVRQAAVAAAVLAIAMLSATYLPARRAAKLNPADALRSD